MIREVINQYRSYSPTYGPGYTNHLPMGLYALAQLGADKEHLEDYGKNYVQSRDIAREESSGEGFPMLGKRSSYRKWIRFFEKEFDLKGREETLRETLTMYAQGVPTALYHGLIRIAYGVMSDNDEEIIRGLAYYLADYQESALVRRRIPAEAVENGLLRLYEDRQSFVAILPKDGNMRKMEVMQATERFRERAFTLEGSLEEQLKWIGKAVTELFILTNNFFILHGVTGYQALRILLPYYEEPQIAVDAYLTSLQGVLLTREDLVFKKVDLKRDFSPEEVAKVATTAQDVHTIKLVYSSLLLYEETKEDYYLRAAALRLFEDDLLKE